MPAQSTQLRSPLLLLGGILLATGLILLVSGHAQELLLTAIRLWKGDPSYVDPPRTLTLLILSSFGIGSLLLLYALLPSLQRERVGVRLGTLLASRKIIAISAMLLLTCILLKIVIDENVVIDGVRYWWLFDDAMISMRYAESLASGHGLVWNPGERVEGYSNFLWTCYMAVVHLFSLPDSKRSLVILLTNIAIAVATIPVLVRIVERLGGGPLARAATVLAYVLDKEVTGWATSGLETSLLTLAFLWTLSRILDESEDGRVRPATYLLLATIPLIRAESIVHGAILGGIALAVTSQKKKVLLYGGLALLPTIVHGIARVSYYGDLFPNTTYLKVVGWDDKYRSGAEYVIGFARIYLVPLCIAVITAIRIRDLRIRLIVIASLLLLGYVVYIGGDAFPSYRFFLPIVPLLLALTFIGIERWSDRGGIRLALTVLAFVTLPIIGQGDLKMIYPKKGSINNVTLGLLVRKNTPPDATVMDGFAGSSIYFSQRYGIDYLGKCDRYIAHLPVVAGNQPGHNKFDYDYSLGKLKPDVVIAPFALPIDTALMRRKVVDTWNPFGARMYFHPLFQQHCLPYPINVQSPRAIFIPDWSPLFSTREEWKPVERK